MIFKDQLARRRAGLRGRLRGRVFGTGQQLQRPVRAVVRPSAPTPVSQPKVPAEAAAPPEDDAVPWSQLGHRIAGGLADPSHTGRS